MRADKLTYIFAAAAIFWTVPAFGDTSSDKLKEAFKTKIASAIKFDDAEVDITSIDIQGDLPESAVEVRILESPPFGGSIRGQIKSASPDDDRRSRPAWARIDANINVPVPVTAARVEEGTSVDEVQLKMEKRKLESLPRQVVSRGQLNRQYVFRSTLDKGAVVSDRHLKKPVVINRDDVVTIEVNRGAVRIRDRGVARGAARIGETVRVESKSSGSTVEAIAKRPGVVEVP